MIDDKDMQSPSLVDTKLQDVKVVMIQGKPKAHLELYFKMTS